MYETLLIFVIFIFCIFIARYLYLRKIEIKKKNNFQQQKTPIQKPVYKSKYTIIVPPRKERRAYSSSSVRHNSRCNDDCVSDVIVGMAVADAFSDCSSDCGCDCGGD